MANTLIFLLKKKKKKNCNSYTYFCSKNISVFENTLATTVNEFVIYEFVKLKMLLTISPDIFSYFFTKMYVIDTH